MTKVSIIIPVYNVEPYLKRGLDSVINQTLSDIEIICVDDCSTDNSLQILREYEQKDNRIKVIAQEVNKSQGVARNLGIEIASGEYIMFLDPDDWYELDACEKAYNQISKNNNDVVFFNYNEHYQDGRVKTNPNYTKQLKPLVGKTSLNNQEDFIPHKSLSWSKIYNTKFLRDNDCKYTETRQSQDIPFSVQIVCFAKSISVLDEVLYNYSIFDATKNKLRKGILATRTKKCHENFENKKRAYDIVVNCENSGNFLKTFLIYYTRTLQLQSYDFFTKRDKSLKEQAFNYMHQYFSEIDADLIEQMKDDIYDYSRFKRFVECKTLREFEIKDFLAKICSTSHNSTHKYFNFLGFQLRVKKDKNAKN